MTEQFMTPNPWSSQDTICIPEHACLNNGNPNIPAEMLSRGTLILGETGSGKTFSGVACQLKAVIRRGKGETQCAALVVDPKHELIDVVRQEAEERMIAVGGIDGPRLDFYEVDRGRISIKEALDKAIRYLSPQGEAIKSGRGDNTYWHAAAYELVAALTELTGAVESNGKSLLDVARNMSYWPSSSRASEHHPDLTRFIRITKYVGGYWLPSPDEDLKAYSAKVRVYLAAVQQHITSHYQRKKITRRNGQHSDVMRAIRLMTKFVRSYGTTEEAIAILESWSRRLSDKADAIATSLWESVNPDPMSQTQKNLIEVLHRVTMDSTASWYSAANAILSQLLKALECGRDSSGAEFRTIGSMLIAIADDLERFDIASSLAWMQSADTRTAYWHCDIAKQFLAPLVDAGLSCRLWLDPITPCPDGYSVKEAMNMGMVTVYQPPGTIETSANNAFGRALKSIWFASTFSRSARERGVAYVCDEFQRFATSDPESSEANYVDRCRAYRGIVVLATQSIASLRLQLHRADKSVSHAEASATLDVLLANMGSKFWFRSTDPDTILYLRRAIPHSGSQHVIDIRPPTTLNVGECYYLMANGTVGRRQIRLAEPCSNRRAA